MAKKNRNTLKKYFSEGAMPRSEHFADLIDSSLNTIDEGVRRTQENGYEISLFDKQERLLSFFRKIKDEDALVWSLSHNKKNDTLAFVKPDEEEEGAAPPLTLAPNGRVGINQAHPRSHLDVDGVISHKGRIGNYLEGLDAKSIKDGRAYVKADGKWHNITGPLRGCQAFEVMAGVGKLKTGQYAMMHATVLNAFNPTGYLFNFLNLKKRIRYTQSFYLNRAQKLKLRWMKSNEEEGIYFLQMRTNSKLEDGIWVQYYLTQLWFDEDMSASWRPEETPNDIDIKE